MLVHIDLGALYAFKVKSIPLSTVSSASSRPRCPSTVPELTLKVFTTRGGGYSRTLPIRVCAAQRGRDFEAPDLERGIHFRGVF